MTMYRLLAFGLLLVAARGQSAAGAPAPKQAEAGRSTAEAQQDGVVIRVSLPKQTRVGDALWLEIDLVNDKHPIVLLYEPRGQTTFVLDVQRLVRPGAAETESVGLTRYGRETSAAGHRVAAKHSLRRILQGYALRYRVNLAALYDLSKLGYYTLSVSPKRMTYPKGIVPPGVRGMRFYRDAVFRDSWITDRDGAMLKDYGKYYDMCKAKLKEIRDQERPRE